VTSGRPDTITELLRSFWWRVAAAAAGMGSTFALTVIAVRTLDHEEAAGFFAILAALGIGPSIGRLGLGPNVIRLIPAEPDREQRRVIAGIHLRVTALLTLSTAPIVAAFATAGLIGHGNFLAAFLLTSAIIVIETLRMMLSDIFAAVGRIPASVATTHYIRSTMVLPVVGLVAITLQRPTLTILLGAYVVVAAVQFAIALWFARRDVAVLTSAGVASLREAIGKGTRLYSLELSGFLIMPATIWLANTAFALDSHPVLRRGDHRSTGHYSGGLSCAGGRSSRSQALGGGQEARRCALAVQCRNGQHGRDCVYRDRLDRGRRVRAGNRIRRLDA